MGVSRGTVQRLLKTGRAKMTSAVLGSRALLIGDEEHHEGVSTEEES